MSKSIPGGYKDENGIFQRNPPTPAPLPPIVKEDLSDVDIDHELKRILRTTRTFLNHIHADIGPGNIKRDSGDNLKKCLDIFMSIKKYEKDVLDKMSDEELEKLAND